MIVVSDINEIWRRKPFAAMAEHRRVLGVAPADWLVSGRRSTPKDEGSLKVLPLLLPFGWASKTRMVGQRMLWKAVQDYSAAQNEPIEAVILTSPHYLYLLDLVPDDVPCFYYASDDYRSYEGWSKIVKAEQELVQRVKHSFFVSEGLAQRAVEEYGIDAARVSVSMNATEERFFPQNAASPVLVPEGDFERPIAGVVGGINERLDFDLLYRCAEQDEVGTLLLVGPVPTRTEPMLTRLLNHPKCRSVGAQPHDRIHQWFQCLDVGLVTYVDTVFNRMCSPMRLFDHLASGAPVVCNAVCEQARLYPGQVTVAESEDAFATAVAEQLGQRVRPAEGVTWHDRAVQMLQTMGLDDAP